MIDDVTVIRVRFLTFPHKITYIMTIYRSLPIDVNSTDSLALHVTIPLDQAGSFNHDGMNGVGADGITISNSS
jgi:hypothetical protein